MRNWSVVSQQARRAAWIAAVLTVAGAVRAQTAAPDSTDHVKLGQQADLDGHYDAARQHFAAAIERATAAKKVQALRAMAVSYAFTRDAAHAASYEQQAIAAQTAAHDLNAAAETDNELARIYLESGDAKNAYRWYHDGYEAALRMPALSDSAKDLWTFRWEHAQARIAAREGHLDDAHKHVAAAKGVLDRGHIPDQVRFFPYLTGYVAFYGGDNKRAIADLETADQHDPFILVLLAQAHEKAGDAAQATDYYHQVMASTAHNPPNAFARPIARQKLAGS